MQFKELRLKGAYLIELDEHIDERGGFARQFCKKELQSIGINFDICQCNISKNYKKGVLRGLHYQKAPHLEAKVVSCFKGAIFDCIVDLREDSPTYLKHESVELSEDNNKILYIPPNFAHGFQTLVDNSVVFYQLDTYFVSESYSGLRFDDSKLGIIWPDKTGAIMNDRDKNYELL
jgi:dTDP-4-dehydrorhamnose 3,5-epimerase